MGVSEFLQWGPSGLAALMLVLTIYAITKERISAARERLLKFFMVVGFASLIVSSLLAWQQGSSGLPNYTMRFQVFPADLDTHKDFPPPRVNVDGQLLAVPRDFKINGNATATIDVSAAMLQAGECNRVVDRQVAALRAVEGEIGQALTQLQQSNSLATGAICPGGSNGRPASAAPEIARINNLITGALRSAQTAAQAVSP